MIPSTQNVLDLAETFLRETSTAGWRGKHPIQTVHDHHIERGSAGKVTIKETRSSPGHKVLAPDLSGAGTLGDVMLKAVGTIDPKLRKALELRAEGYSCDAIGKRMKMSRNKASNTVRTAISCGRMFLLLR